MAAGVELEMSGDEQRLVRALSRSEREVDKLKAKLKETANEGQKSQNSFDKLGGSIKDAFDPMRVAQFVGGMAGVVSVTAGVSKAIAAVKAELQSVIDLQKKMADANLTVESSTKDVLRNLPGATGQQADEVRNLVTKISKSTGIKEQYIGQGFAQGLSASGGNVPAVAKSVELAAKYLPDKPGEIGSVVGAMLDLGKVTGSDSAQVNLGFMSYLGGLSRVVNPQQQAQNIPPALLGQMAFGSTPEQAGAIFAALSNAMADREGAKAGTAAVALAKQLNEFLPAAGVAEKVEGGLSAIEQIEMERKRPEANKVLAKISAGVKETDLSENEFRIYKEWRGFTDKAATLKVTPARPGLKTTGERIAYLQQHPELLPGFMSESSFEGKSEGVIEQLFGDPNSQAAKLFAEYSAKMPAMGAMGETVGQMFGTFKSDPRHRLGEIARAYANVVEQGMLQNLVGAEGSINREGLQNVLMMTGRSVMGTKYDMLAFEGASRLGTGESTQSAIRILESRQRELAEPYYEVTSNFMGVQRTRRDPTEREEKTAELLGVVIGVLQEQLQVQRDQNRKLRGNPTMREPTEDK